jgi:predicted RNA-binding protein
MCEANAYLIEDGNEQLIMESVDTVAPEGPGLWRLVNIFGEQRTLRGRVGGMNLVEHKIWFEALDDESPSVPI